MAAAYRQGVVFVQNIFAGVVSETDSGYKFEYHKDNKIYVEIHVENINFGQKFKYIIEELKIIMKNWSLFLGKIVVVLEYEIVSLK